MSDGLTDRLRFEANRDGISTDPANALFEAADEIETLARRVEELEAENARLCEALRRSCEEGRDAALAPKENGK